MTNLRLTPQEWQRLTMLRDSFDKAVDIIDAALSALTHELQNGVDAYRAEEDREDGDPPADREELHLFLDGIAEIDCVSDAIFEYKERLQNLRRRWYSPKRQKRRARHEQPEIRRHAPSRRNGASTSVVSAARAKQKIRTIIFWSEKKLCV